RSTSSTAGEPSSPTPTTSAKSSEPCSWSSRGRRIRVHHNFLLGRTIMGRRIAVLALSLLAFGAAMITPARADDAILKAHLTGAAERPGPGDPDAVGDATV